MARDSLIPHDRYPASAKAEKPLIPHARAQRLRRGGIPGDRNSYPIRHARPGDRFGRMTKKKKRERELEKLHETEDEKRARRLAKKAAKAEKQRALLGGYSNESNPWNDASLTDQFVWSKKVDKDRTMGISSDSAEAQKRRREAQVEELKKVKRAREQREVEREQQEQERRLIERERESMAFDDNERREDEFQLQQTVLRAHIRVQEGRAKPVDVLSESLSLLRDDLPAERAFDIALQEPLAIFHGLSERELRELHADISTHAELDVERRPFWAAMIDVCAHSLDEIAGGSAAAPGVHAAVDADVAAMLSGKTGEELDALHAQIEAQLRGGDATGGAVDSDYWEVVLRRLSRCFLEGSRSSQNSRGMQTGQTTMKT